MVLPPLSEDPERCARLYAETVRTLDGLHVDSDLSRFFLERVQDAFSKLLNGTLNDPSLSVQLRLNVLRTLRVNLADGLAASFRGTPKQRNALRDAGRALFLKLRAESIQREKDSLT